MDNMREIKSRIKSINETRQITKAMKLISAAKLKKARQQLEQTVPFFEKVRATMADILIHSGDVESIFLDLRNKKEGRKYGYIIITADKGLAGSYNHNLIKYAERMLEGKEHPRLFVIGQIGRNHFIRNKYDVYENFDYSAQNPTVYRAREITELIVELFINGELDEIYLIYTHMESSMKQEPTMLKLLPLELGELRKSLNISDQSLPKIDSTLLYEPSPEAVFNVLVPKYIKGIIYGALVESFTSEYTARMTAMDNATANADEMLEKLRLYYNRARQAAITQEITEVVGGAQALNNA